MRANFIYLFLGVSGAFAAFSSLANAEELVRPFATDGCTFFVNGTLDQPELWKDCCLEHDLHLWAGGSTESRNRTDLRLRDCVTEKGQPDIAALMYAGVAMGRHSGVKIPGKQWGNAWAVPAYHKLTLEQVKLIEADLPNYEIPADIEARFIDAIENDVE